MLTELIIRNFAIIDRLQVSFGPGFNVLTGETGAGKSILVDALGLVLGDRADSSVIRHGCERAEISASLLGEQAGRQPGVGGGHPEPDQILQLLRR